MILALVLPSCSSNVRPRKYKPNQDQPAANEQIPMPRADPSYVQYLERNSLLTKSSEMARVVSGSELAWKSPSSTGAPDELLGFADTWLAIHPLTLLTSNRSSAFEQLSDPTVSSVLREASIKGLYVAPIQGGGNLWAKERRGIDTGEDVVQYSFSSAAGKDEQYRTLMNKLIDNHSLMGSDLIPAATGLGPDFFLATRNIREYPGIYCMVDIPQPLWELLPETASEWDTVPLGPSQVNALNTEGILPKAMRDEISPLGHTGGWAATGAVRGVDGHSRRWVYRYYENPKYAVLNWEDPSQTAHRILSGGAVQQVGLRGQALIGLRFEAFQGLEPAPTSATTAAKPSRLEPALTAAQSMSREIHRYGGWSWVRDDNLPLNNVVEFLNSGSDFLFDSAFSPAAEHALLTGDTTFACFMADELLRLGIDSRRLVHTLPAQDGINYTLPYLKYLETTSVGTAAKQFRLDLLEDKNYMLSSISPSPEKDGYLYTTSAGLAAMALDMPKQGDTKRYAKEIAKGHSLLVFFKAMQPGVLMLSGQDLAGVLPLHWSSMTGTAESWDVANSSRGTYALTSAADKLTVSTQGMPKAAQLYPAPDTQVHQQGSFLRRIGSFLRARTQLGVAKGKLIARPNTKNYGAIALLTRLPDGKSFLLSVSNFSRDPIQENVSLAGISGISSALSHITTISLGGSHSVSGQNINVRLGPWEGRAFIIGSAASGLRSVSGETVTVVNPIVPTPAVEVAAPQTTAAPQQQASAPIPTEKSARPVMQNSPPSSEPVQKVIPLAHMSEEKAGTARQKQLRPDQPAELVTNLSGAQGGKGTQKASAATAKQGTAKTPAIAWPPAPAAPKANAPAPMVEPPAASKPASTGGSVHYAPLPGTGRAQPGPLPATSKQPAGAASGSTSQISEERLSR